MKDVFPRDFITSKDEGLVFRVMESADFFFVVDTRKKSVKGHYTAEFITNGKNRADRARAEKRQKRYNSVVTQAFTG